jgi:hypothetical protein
MTSPSRKCTYFIWSARTPRIVYQRNGGCSMRYLVRGRDIQLTSTRSARSAPLLEPISPIARHIIPNILSFRLDYQCRTYQQAYYYGAPATIATALWIFQLVSSRIAQFQIHDDWPHILLQLRCLSVRSSRPFEFHEAQMSQSALKEPRLYSIGLESWVRTYCMYMPDLSCKSFSTVTV